LSGFAPEDPSPLILFREELGVSSDAQALPAEVDAVVVDD
jgi:hypothetical protein